MPTIVAPQPLPVAFGPCHSTISPLVLPSTYLSPDQPLLMASPRVLVTPPRLQSPIHLGGPGNRQPSLTSRSPCISTPRRRSARRLIRSPRVPRQSSRVDCPIGSAPHLFDQLPWISALESAPEQCGRWDIADLSQIIDEDPVHSGVPASGLGPIRRRKTSLRTNPFISSETKSLPEVPSLWAGSMFPFRETSNRTLIDPRTPCVPIQPSRVRFHNLMPEFFRDSQVEPSL